MDSPVRDARPRASGAALPFVIFGAAAIVFAGLFSAATARSTSYHSAWLVAYLVLVVGVAQIALGVGQSARAGAAPRAAIVASELVFFNLGNAGVILGTMIAASIWVDMGSVLLIVALAFFGWAVRSPERRGPALWAYWALIALLLASVLVGVFFAHFGAP